MLASNYVIYIHRFRVEAVLEWVNGDTGRRWSLEVVKRPEGTKGFVLLAKRLVVERTHAWIGAAEGTVATTNGTPVRVP